MRRTIVYLVFLIVPLTPPLSAQGDDGTGRRVPLRQCISQFYDRTMYNWLSLKNNCTDAVVEVTFCGQTKYGCSATTIRPGMASNTGYSEREVNDRGGFALYVCPKGSGTPYRQDGRLVTTGPEGPYLCERPATTRPSSSRGVSTIDFSNPSSSGSSSSENATLVTDHMIRQRHIKDYDNSGHLVDRIVWEEPGGKWYCVQFPWNTMGPQTKCVMRNGTTPFPFKRARFR